PPKRSPDRRAPSPRHLPIDEDVRFFVPTSPNRIVQLQKTGPRWPVPLSPCLIPYPRRSMPQKHPRRKPMTRRPRSPAAHPPAPPPVFPLTIRTNFRILFMLASILS